MAKDIVGFGDMSAGRATTTSNAFFRVTTKPVFEGAELVVECKDGMVFADGDATKTLVAVRERREPRPGQRVMVDGRLVKVLRTKRDRGGRLLLLDEDTKGWVVYGQ